MKDLDTLQVCGIFGSVWSDQLLLHNYCVIISDCQKETFMGVKEKNWSKNGRRKKSCLKLPDLRRKLTENDF